MQRIAWQEALATYSENKHLAQTYRDDRLLVESVGRYAASGLQAGQAVLLLATQAHLQSFEEKLVNLGVEPTASKARGALRFLTVEEVLRQTFVHGMPERNAFWRAAASALEDLRRTANGGGIRVFTELVNILWLSGQVKSVETIERYWNDLREHYAFTLLCSYHMDPFDRRPYAGAIQAISASHSHLIPSEDYERLEEAVHHASCDVLGKDLANLVKQLADSGEGAPAVMPRGQRILLWLRENMPATAENISTRSKHYYRQLLS